MPDIKSALFLTVVSAITLPTASLAEREWQFKLMPYALAPSIDGNTTLGRLRSAGLSVDPVDIVNALDFGLMVYGEALHSSGWGISMDYAFMDLSDSGRFAAGAGSADAEVFQATLTGFVFRRVHDSNDHLLDLYAGFRWWDMDIEADASLGPLSGAARVTEDWIDPHIGIRYRRQLGAPDWTFAVQGDVGGFGMSSEFAWTAQAGFAWQARYNMSLEIAYKAIGVDYRTGRQSTPGYFAYDTITHGPLLGVSFQF